MRFRKLGADGAYLPDDATTYAAIEDTETGLFWSTTLKVDVTHAQAVELAAACTAAGLVGWQLPTLKQLETLRDLTRFAPATHEALAADTRRDWYWSSSPCAGDEDCAWILYFSYGGTGWDHRDIRACVRAVRSAAPAAGQ